MKKKYKRFLIMLTLGLLSVVLVHRMSSALSKNTMASQQAIPKAEKVVAIAQKQGQQDPQESCAPYGSRDAEIIARATDSKGHEHVLWRYTKGASGSSDAGDNYFIKVTTLLGPVCGATYDPAVDSAITDRIELDTARDLSLQMYQLLIEEAGGRESFQREFLDNLEEQNLDPFEKPKITSVEVWVLSELGIEVPENQYQLEDIDSNYRYDEAGQVGF
jgi:hypothetical protein